MVNSWVLGQVNEKSKQRQHLNCLRNGLWKLQPYQLWVVFGPDEDLAYELHHVADFLSDWDSSQEAEGLYIRALNGKEKALGAEHTSTLDAVNNLGTLYTDQGKLSQAQEMYMRALEGKEKALGAEHTSTLDTVNILGILYADQGKLSQAQEMYMRALEGKEKALGAEHTSTLDTVNILGILYADQGKLSQAEEMYVRALEGYKAAPYTNATRINGLQQSVRAIRLD